jgi:gas vesicle protein
LWRAITGQSFDNQKEITMFDRDVFEASFVGFLVGSVSGAVVALLYAPQSGQETRAMIKDKSIELRDKAQVTAKEAIARAEAITAERADELARRLRHEEKPDVVEELTEPAKSAVDAARSKVKKPAETSEPVTA